MTILMDPDSTLVYRIVVRGHVSEQLARRLGLQATILATAPAWEEPPIYSMTGTFRDQSVLRSIVNYLDDSALQILAFTSQAAVPLSELFEDSERN